MERKKVTIDGYKYSYSEAGSSNKTLLIMHGIGNSSEFGENLFKNFPDHRCISINLPGHKDVPNQGLSSLDSLVEYLHTFIQKLDPAELSLVGFSFGGILATLYEQKYGNVRKIDKLVLWSVPFEGVNLPPILTLRFIVLISSLTRKGSKLNVKILHSLLNVFRFKLSSKEIDSLSRFDGRYVLRLIGEIKNIYPADNVPTLILHSQSEKGFRYINKDKIAQGLRKKVIMVKDGGHFGTKEGWNESIKLICMFINGK